MNPLISILIPNYNHSRFLKQRLESVFKQTFQDFEVILLDDASTDDSVKLLKTYKSHPKVSHFLVNDTNSGSPFMQWRKGFDLAKGKYIWIAESDDYCDASFLENMMHLFSNNPALGLGYCQTQDVDDIGDELLHRIVYTSQFHINIWKNDFVINGKEFITKYLNVINVIPNASAVVFKKELIADDFFSNSMLKMKMCGDWFFWIKICLTSKVGFVSNTLNYFRHHQNISRLHISKEKKKTRLYEESILRKHIFYALNFTNIVLENKMYKKWFQLHERKELLTINFHSIRLPNKNRITYVLDFLKFKNTKE